MKILYSSDNEAIKYAADELKKYIHMMCNINIELRIDKSFDSYDGHVIYIGLLDDFNLDTSDLEDALIDDIIDIDVKNCSGYIAGSNPRSVLMGVYKYLKFAGCRFMRPGPDGEYIPKVNISEICCKYRKKADHPFRGECSEGAVSYEHMRDTVYWMPKVGMNLFMIEGLVPYTYMHKWYGHVGNTKLRQKGQITDYEFLEGEIAKLEKDITKTGLQFHAVGHGWMFEKFGIHHGPGHLAQAQLKETDKKYLAMVNGKRDIMHGSPFYTHFCYSNPEARKLLVDFWVDYAKQKPYIDYFHIWLADACNNQCECSECQKKEPSDFYVQLLNEIDEALTSNGIDSRLAFILYVDTQRPPRLEKLNNPKRFLMLSTCGSEYSTGYTKEVYEGEEPPFVRNKWHAPDKALSARWRNEWQLSSDIPLKSCVFEYRFYTDQYSDMGHMQLTQECYRDMQNLKNAGFDGIMDDQTARAFFPTALPMLVRSEALFDKGMELEGFINDYFRSAFGADGDKCRHYLEGLSQLLCPNLIRNDPAKPGIEENGIVAANDTLAKSWYDNPDYAAQLDKISNLIEDFEPVIKKNLTHKTECIAASWKYLNIHAYIVKELSKAYHRGALGDKSGAARIYLGLIDYISEREMEIHDVFDLCLFDRYNRAKFDLPAVNYYD